MNKQKRFQKKNGKTRVNRQMSFSKSADTSLIEKFRFVNFGTYSWTASSTIVSVPMFQVGSITTQWGTRFSTLFQIWNLYKVRKLKVIISPLNNATSPSAYLFAYSPAVAGVTDATTFSDLAEKNCSHVHSPTLTQPSSFSVPRNLLNTNQDKYFSTTSTSSLNEFLQGHLYAIPTSSTTATLTVTLEFIVEFRGMTTGSEDLIKKVTTTDLIKELERRSSEKSMKDKMPSSLRAN